MNEMKILSIGKKKNNEQNVLIKLDPKFADGLKELNGFSHIQVLWWADKAARDTLVERKPYTPSIDRVENSKSPDWCSHWPESYEESGSFN